MIRELDAQCIQEGLGLSEETLPWLNQLESTRSVHGPIRLPAPTGARAVLDHLAKASAHHDAIIAAMPTDDENPVLWWIMERCHRLLIQEMGSFGELRPWPTLPTALGDRGTFLYVWVFIATLEAVRQYHRSRGIPDDVAWATLADVGRNMEIHERMHGVPGLSAQNWLTLHFRGALYHLGRLQFNRSRIRYDATVLEEGSAGFTTGDPAIGVHIPETGPLSPEACDASFRWAHDFFSRHFPEEPCRIATCGSWLLDDQLAEYLPPDSNIVRFQRRFRLLPGGRVGDEEIVRFVFRRTGASLDDLPQRTTLERAIVRHLRSGRHWRTRFGWVEL